MLNNKKKIVMKITAVTFWVAVWFIASVIVDNRLLIASPYDTVVALIRLAGETTFYVAVCTSLVKIMLGFVVGTALGMLGAWAAYGNSLIKELLGPAIALCKTVPVAVFAVILIIWFGPANLGLLIGAIIVLPIAYINMSEGLESVDKKMLEMAKVLDMPRRNRTIYIYKPALRPYIMSSVKTGIGMAWKAGVAAEVIGLASGTIGGQLYNSKVYFETAEIFVWAGVTVILSLIMEKLMVKVTELSLNTVPVCAVKPEYCRDKKDITVDHISKKYGDRIIYSDYSCVYKNGESYTISEPSGSGKTTLLLMLAGVIKPDEGSIDPTKVSMVFQEDRLCEDYSAVTNVAMTGISEVVAREALAKVLESDCLDKPCRELSGGMKRRVAIVRAMENGSDAVLMDEPFTGMDEVTIAMVKKYIEERQMQRTMIIATHIMD